VRELKREEDPAHSRCGGRSTGAEERVTRFSLQGSFTDQLPLLRPKAGRKRRSRIREREVAGREERRQEKTTVVCCEGFGRRRGKAQI